jgi:hypothetical protein
MTSIRNVMRYVAAVLVVVGGFVATSEASTISIVPGSQTIAPGGTAGIDIVLSGLLPSETVGGFSLVLSFDNTILGAPETFTPNPDGKMGAAPLDLSGGFSFGKLDLFYLADAAISEADLKTAEGTGFRLAHVGFTGLAVGVSPLALSVSPTTGVFLSDYLGTGVVPASAVGGIVCVAAPGLPTADAVAPCAPAPSVPEPATLSLLGVGVAGFLARRRHQARSDV